MAFGLKLTLAAVLVGIAVGTSYSAFPNDKAVVDAFEASYSNMDATALSATFFPEARWELNDEDTLKGRSAIYDHFQGLFEMFQDMGDVEVVYSVKPESEWAVEPTETHYIAECNLVVKARSGFLGRFRVRKEVIKEKHSCEFTLTQGDLGWLISDLKMRLISAN